MKKFSLFLAVCALTQLSVAQPFTSVWQKLANGTDFSWFTSASGAQANNVTSLDYNPATNKLLVACRNNNVYILNVETGAQEGTLPVTGLGAEAFKFNKIRVTSDGVIYGISLATAAGKCKIYRWANQTTNPTLCAEFDVTERCGDAFGLSGSGNNTILYASGAALAAGGGNSINIYMLTTANGTSFTTESKINLPTQASGVTQWANRAIDPVANSLTSDLWINSGGGPARRITVGANNAGVRTAALAFATTDGTGSGQASNGYGGLRYLVSSVTNNKYLIFSGGNNSFAGTKMKMLNVTDEANVFDYGQDSLGLQTAYQTNANGTGDAAFKLEANGEYTIFYVSTNNGIEATRSGSEILPVGLADFNATLRGKAALVSWVTASESNNDGFAVERSANGTDFARIAYVRTKAPGGNSSNTLSYSFTDNRPGTGRTYYRLVQVDRDGRSAYSAIKWVQTEGSSSLQATLITNPARDRISLSLSSKSGHAVQISVASAGGAVLYSRQHQVAADGTGMVTIPVSGWSRGIYLITLTDGQNNRQVLRAMVE